MAPPLQLMTCPVRYDASSLTRNLANFATSSGRPPPPPPEDDGPIDQIIDGVTGFFRGDRNEPPPSEFEDRPPPRPRERDRRQQDPPY